MSHNHHDIEGVDRELPEFNDMQRIKRRFFAMRNGALAAQMRAGGLVYQINFGLNLPQIKEIAAEVNGWNLSTLELAGLAEALWRNRTTRESMLLAPMIYPYDVMTADKAGEWMAGVPTQEVADTLCHSLVRRLPFAGDMALALMTVEVATDMNRYTALRLLMNLIVTGKGNVNEIEQVALAERERDCALTRQITRQILEEVAFLRES